ncbi:MAG: hypothetical protein E6J41_06590 [Chloroflexi bacterium]|nr:MAG: hypothetical protein E6J41_06590 [Chloroflexota bacterium]
MASRPSTATGGVVNVPSGVVNVSGVAFVAVEVPSACRTKKNCVPVSGFARASIRSAGSAGAGAATTSVLASGATDCTK